MQQKLIKTLHAEFVQAPYMGENKSGWTPIGDLVLVRPDAIAMKSSGGVELPEELAERMQLAATTGVIVACGDEAFKWNADRTRLFDGEKPKPGDRIIFEKYAGKPIRGDDGNDYRFLDDKCIGGVQTTGKVT